MQAEPLWAVINRKAAKSLGGHAAVARLLNLPDRRNVFPWTSGRRVFPEAYCIAIERATGGMVTRADLRPHDWQQIWPEYTPPNTGKPAEYTPPPAGTPAAGTAQPQPKPFKPRVRANARKAAKHHPKEAQA